MYVVCATPPFILLVVNVWVWLAVVEPVLDADVEPETVWLCSVFESTISLSAPSRAIYELSVPPRAAPLSDTIVLADEKAITFGFVELVAYAPAAVPDTVSDGILCVCAEPALAVVPVSVTFGKLFCAINVLPPMVFDG